MASFSTPGCPTCGGSHLALWGVMANMLRTTEKEDGKSLHSQWHHRGAELTKPGQSLLLRFFPCELTVFLIVWISLVWVLHDLQHCNWYIIPTPALSLSNYSPQPHTGEIWWQIWLYQPFYVSSFTSISSPNISEWLMMPFIIQPLLPPQPYIL